MAQNKTVKSNSSAPEFISSISDPLRRADCKKIAKMMRAATGKNARMWGSNIVGYGTYDYKYASGREGNFFLCGFSPRAQNITVYIMPGFSNYSALMKKLGKYKTGKSCLYVERLSDVDESSLNSLVQISVRDMRDKYTTY